MQQLLEKLFFPVFGSSTTIPHDSTVLNLPHGKIAYTTDSYVINPLFFPGGDIGSLAVHGTVNDLAMSGARPLYLSVGFILEEGLPMETLWKVVQSMGSAAKQANVQIITGDTKVVNRGKGDGIFINTSGIGVIDHSSAIAPQSVQVGDKILINGDIGRHGIAIMAVREGLEFETTIESDSAPLSSMVLDLIESGVKINCLRDLTRGGLSSTLNEIASSRGLTLEITENSIPIREDVQGACEILGFDPLYVANEGRFVAFIPPSSVELALERMKMQGMAGAIIGEVTENDQGKVILTSSIGANRILDMLSGEQLPRIC